MTEIEKRKIIEDSKRQDRAMGELVDLCMGVDNPGRCCTPETPEEKKARQEAQARFHEEYERKSKIEIAKIKEQYKESIVPVK